MADMRLMDPDQVQWIIVEALDAVYHGDERMLGTIPVYGPTRYGPGSRAWTLSLYLDRTVGQPGNMTLAAEESILGA